MQADGMLFSSPLPISPQLTQSAPPQLPACRALCKWMTYWFGTEAVLGFFTTGEFKWTTPFGGDPKVAEVAVLCCWLGLTRLRLGQRGGVRQARWNPRDLEARWQPLPLLFCSCLEACTHLTQTLFPALRLHSSCTRTRA